MAEEKREERKGDMTVREAGQKGGETTAATHGKEFYEDIGRKGGETTSATHGREFYQDIGQKGGEVGGPKVKELIEKGKRTEE
jgi:uncharacterized protein